MDTKTILLSRGLTTQVDSDVYEWASHFNWWASSNKCKNVYAVRLGSVREPTTVYLHKAILCPPEGFCVDHIDRNSLNNLKSNLRVCTQQQNLWNVNDGYGTSRYKGVHLVKRKTALNKCWLSRIRTKDGRKYIGYYESEEEAAIAYDLRALTEHGEFACFNFPELKEKYLGYR